MNKTRRIIVCALLTTVSLALFAVELLIPPFPFCPGAKIGLANIIVLYMISNDDFFKNVDCFLVIVSRCLLSALITGRLMAVLFSLSGSIAAFAAMIIMRRFLKKEHTICISISGAVFHNMGQSIVSVLIYGTFSVLYYIPVLFLTGVACGILTGLCVKLMNRLNLNKIILK